ncbi:hypothetical protein [Mesorhizobium sp. J428]|uniref:hypothetical protein n=1 Tax=Mesorhizobium sp. J428 TaxID=2898440 RepID=UPI0021518B9D|nr:hypothetical protein [Mesorhizobium sp. J428]MCR5855880.1 hypothetical protein [Mesorhizobium sp. J428]
MVKFIVAAVWIVAVTVGSIFFAFSSTSDKPGEVEKPAPFFGGLDYVKTDVISVPVVKNGEVAGYFIARFVFTAEPARIAKMSVPMQSIITDEFFTYLYSNPLIDFTRGDRIDINAFRSGLRDNLNKRLGEDVVHEVMMEQVDYLSKQEIRDNAMKRRIPPKAKQLPEAPKPSSGH